MMLRHTCSSASRLACAMMLAVFVMASAIAFALPGSALAQSSSVRPPDTAVTQPEAGPTGGSVPGDSLGTSSDSDIWRAVKQGVSGSVSIPDGNAATLVRPGGDHWRLLRNGPLFDWLGFAILGMIVLLGIFFAIRGRIRIEGGRSGRTISRFNLIERTAHWVVALSFITLAISGLNITFGRELLIPVIGKEGFAAMSNVLKPIHNYVAFAFMAGLVVEFIAWVRHNLPSRHDIVWLVKGGGIIGNAHVPSRKFNAGQKLVFWVTIIGGLSLSLSGWALLFPFTTNFFGDTFVMLQGIGIDIPAWLGLAQPPYDAVTEQMYNSIWHAVVAVAMICLMLAHIYIGSVGMEGALEAMTDGEVDINWAREHHDLWVREVEEKSNAAPPAAAAEPAE